MSITNYKLFTFTLFCGFLSIRCDVPVFDAGYKLHETGTKFTFDYKAYYTYKNAVISPVHDIPLYHNETTETFNMIVEIPRWTNAKMEINMVEPLNPIMQDVKNEKLRYVRNIFPHHGYPWNYGALPQTWDRPVVENGLNGDNDPLDVIEIGCKKHKMGDIVPVKVLGAIGLIDEGEMDWKIIAIDVTDRCARIFNDVSDLSKMPGLVSESFKWLKYYKFLNTFTTNTFTSNDPIERIDTLKIIDEKHGHWKLLITGNEDIINDRSCKYTIGKPGIDKNCLMSPADAKAILEKAPQCQNTPINTTANDIVDKLFYIALDMNPLPDVSG